MEILEDVGNGILKKDDPFNETFDIQLIKDLVSALVYVFYKGPAYVGHEHLYELVDIVLDEVKDIHRTF